MANEIVQSIKLDSTFDEQGTEDAQKALRALAKEQKQLDEVQKRTLSGSEDLEQQFVELGKKARALAGSLDEPSGEALAEIKSQLKSLSVVAKKARQDTKALNVTFRETADDLSPLKQRAKIVRQEIAKLGKTAGELSPDKIALINVEMRELQKEAEEAGEDVGDFAKSFDRIDKATTKLKKLRIEQTKLGDELNLSTKEATLQNELFQSSAGTVGQYTAAVGTLTAGLAVGLTAGMKINEKAGTNLDETMRALDETTEVLAKTITKLITNEFLPLGAVIKNAEVIAAGGAAAYEDFSGSIADAGTVTVSYIQALNDLTEQGLKPNRLQVILHREEMQRLATETARADQTSKDFAKTLGLETIEAATERARVFGEQLAGIGSPAALSRSEIDKLITTFRSLEAAGADFDEETKAQVESFGLRSKTLAELSQAQAKAAADSAAAIKQVEAERVRAETQAQADRERIAQDQAALITDDIQRIIARGEVTEETLQRLRKARLAELDLVNQSGAARTLAERQIEDEITAIQQSAEQRRLNLRVTAAQNELALGLNDERIAAFRAASEAEIEASSASTEERLRLETELANQIATLRIKALGDFRGQSMEEAQITSDKIVAILSDEQISAAVRTELSEQTSQQLMDNNAAEAQWAQLTTQQKTQTVVGGANAALGAVSAAFGEQKEIAIAQAVINTYQSATGAYNALAVIPIVGPALGAIAAAAAIIAGLKNIDQIKSSEPAGGGGAAATTPSFDDHTNDAAARFAGAQSARDMANHFGSGFQEQLLTGQSQSQAGNTSLPSIPSSNRTTTINVSGSGFVMPDQIVKALVRQERRYGAVTETKAIRSRARARR